MWPLSYLMILRPNSVFCIKHDSTHVVLFITMSRSALLRALKLRLLAAFGKTVIVRNIFGRCRSGLCCRQQWFAAVVKRSHFLTSVKLTCMLTTEKLNLYQPPLNTDQIQVEWVETMVLMVYSGFQDETEWVQSGECGCLSVLVLLIFISVVSCLLCELGLLTSAHLGLLQLIHKNKPLLPFVYFRIIELITWFTQSLLIMGSTVG